MHQPFTKLNKFLIVAVFFNRCLQCSRFHPLTDFDGIRKNCRQRLQEHNHRQRKSRLMRNTKGPINDESESYQSQYTLPTQYAERNGYKDATDLLAATVAADPDHQLLAPESPLLSEINAPADFGMGSVDLDSLFGQDAVSYDPELMTFDISSAAGSAAEDVWHDPWYKPALGVTDCSCR
jgi:hypothetical protein